MSDKFTEADGLDPTTDPAAFSAFLGEAAAALERNTQLQPMSPYGWYQLARVQIDRAKPEEARKIIRHLQTFEPKVAAQLERETGLAP